MQLFEILFQVGQVHGILAGAEHAYARSQG
jgi:hypothetical protein